MKRGVILINTGRGALIDSKALIEALKDGRIRGAGLDVYEEEDKYFFEDWSLEPIRDDVLARLIQFPNVLLTSHQAFLTEEALGEIARVTLENVRLWKVEDRAPNEICYQCTLAGKPGECARDKAGLCWPKKA
jgi:D-lactate dehydrogenase